MSKIVKKTILFFLSLTTLLSAVACNDSSSDSLTGSGEIEVWGKASTVSVMQDISYDAQFKDVAEYNIIAGKGEYEASQIIITIPAGETAEYSIEVSDLICGENKIDKSYIDVYNEKYINVRSATDTYSTGIGWYADALVPFSATVEAGENIAGKEDALQNQGIYIETFIPRDIPAGDYKGVFELTVEDKTYDIPACVTVCDFEVSQESHLGQDWIVNLMGFGELNTTSAIEYKYFEAVAGYRASTHAMRMGANNADEWMQVVRKYTNPNLRDENGKPLIDEKECYLAAINLPTYYHATWGIDRTTFDSYISRLVYWSIKDGYNYLAKVGTYPGFIDEPHYNNTWDKVQECCEGWNEYKKLWAEEILAVEDIETINEKLGADAENGLTTQDFLTLSTDFKNELVDSMNLIGFYVTTKPDERLNNEATIQFCRPIYSFSTAAEKYRYETWTTVENSGNWAYGAGDSLFGNRIDSEPVEQRLMSYYLYDSNTKGFLVWEAVQYQQISWNSDARANQYMPCDPYTLAQRIRNGSGDGYIFYPGKPYDIDGPIGSIRAHQYRDSSEEYEYFWLLDNLYSKAGYSPDKILKRIFSTLYTEETITNDTEIFAKQRLEIIHLIELAQKGVFVTDYNELAGKATMSIASTADETITKVNGETIAPIKEIEVSHDLLASAGNLSVETTSGAIFTLYLDGKEELVQGADSSVFTMAGGIATTETIDGNNRVKMDFAVDENIEEERRVYQATFSANKEYVNRDTKRLVSEFFNPGEKPILVEMWFMGKDNRTVYVDDVVVYPREYASIVTIRLDSIGWGTIRSFEGIRYKVTSLENEKNYTVHFLGMYAIN